MTARNSLKWCPNGCGKSCWYEATIIKYICKRCEKTFTREEMEAIQNLRLKTQPK